MAEATLPIVHGASRPGLRFSCRRCASAYPVAFDQCRDLIHSLDVRCLPSATTADAAREVAESEDPAEAAIASAEAARIYGLHVIAENVGDQPAAFTRFVAIGPYTRLDVEARCRTAIAFVTDHRPGALVGALQPFARHGLNLVQLVSRPIPHSTFRYRFDLILDGHPLDRELQTALAEMREWTREVRIFGSYAATGDH